MQIFVHSVMLRRRRACIAHGFWGATWVSISAEGEQADSLPMEPSKEAGKVRSSFTTAPGKVGRGGVRWGGCTAIKISLQMLLNNILLLQHDRCGGAGR